MEEKRDVKRRKLFQDVLPAEMIENIVLLCPNTITLASLACTCKQIRAVVAKIPKKNILVSFESRSGKKERSSVEFMIDNNGDVLKKSEYYFGTAGSRNQKFRTVMKKLEHRYLCDKLYEELLRIMNMTDATKITQLIESQDLDVDVFTLHADKVKFDIEIDDFRVHYDYIMRTEDNSAEIEQFQMLHPLHVGDREKELDWNFLDANMITRFKCALCVVKTAEFFKDIPFMERRGDKSVHIEYRKDAIEFEGWNFSFDDSGRATARAFEIDDMPWHQVDEKNIESIQFRPSFVEEIFVALEKQFNSKVLKVMKAKYGEDDNEDEDSDKNSGSDSDFENKSVEKTDEEEKIDIDDEDEDYESSFQGRRTVKLTLNGSKFQYNLPAKIFEEIMNAIYPITQQLDTPMPYE